MGFYGINSKCGYFLGFYQGKFIDFDNDGVPELFCGYYKEFNPNICIYHYDGRKVVLLADKLTGNVLIGEGTCYIEYADIDGKPYILWQDWEKEAVKKEVINIWTVKNDELRTKRFQANVQLKEESILHYFNCMVDDEKVSEEEYNFQKKVYYQKSLKWHKVNENGKYRDYTKDDASQFIKSLASTAGVSESEVNALLKSTPPPTQSAAPETPRQTTNSAG